MKQNGLLVIALAILSSLQLSAQCDSVLTTTTDKFTKKTKIASELMDWENGGQKMFVLLSLSPADEVFSSANLDLYLKPQTTGCIDENAESIFLLDDNSSVKIKSFNSYNCDPHCSFIFFNRKRYSGLGDLQKLVSHKITAIRVTLYSTYFDYDLTKDQSEELQQVLSCGLAKLQSM